MLQENQHETSMHFKNERVKIVDSSTTNFNGGSDNKRLREIEDVSTHDTFDDHDGQRKKKTTSMNMTKDV